MSGCAERDEGTWIGRKIIKAYSALHKAGHAHSVEVWQGTDLVGGIYGVQVGALFAGESMFSRVSDASKVAMVHLIGHLKKQGFLVLDAQVLNNHTESLGAVNVPRSSFLKLLAELRDRPLEFIPG